VKKPTPPKGLQPAPRALWVRLQREYGITDGAGLTLLETAVRAYSRMGEAQRILDADGCVTRDKFGQVKSHPATQVERDSRAGLLAALKALNVDVEPVRSAPGRPPGR